MKQIKSSLLKFNQKLHVNWSLQIINGYHFFINTQYDISVFAMMNSHIYSILVTKWKHGIVTNDIITFNKEIEFLSASIIKLVNSDKSLHKNKMQL